MTGVSEVRKNLCRIRKFCFLSTDKASADLEGMLLVRIEMVDWDPNASLYHQRMDTITSCEIGD